MQGLCSVLGQNGESERQTLARGRNEECVWGAFCDVPASGSLVCNLGYACQGSKKSWTPFNRMFFYQLDAMLELVFLMQPTGTTLTARM